MKNRIMSVSGSFYPSQADEIEEMISRFNSILNSYPEIVDQYNELQGRAVIVPHAGWIYSGFTANIAYRILAMKPFSRVVVIGPSHRVGFEGMSIANEDTYMTPLGEIPIDKVLVDSLSKQFAISHLPNAHYEHSTEVQMPFIKHYLPEVSIVEIVYSHTTASHIEPIIEYCLKQPHTAVVISTDLSHYYNLDQAKRLDSICLESIRNNDPEELHQGCEACGMIGVEAMLHTARSLHLKSTVLDYRTSADMSGDTSRVVGYASILFS
jgi:AmmeMemoRadiSam system protein B